MGGFYEWIRQVGTVFWVGVGRKIVHVGNFADLRSVRTGNRQGEIRGVENKTFASVTPAETKRGNTRHTLRTDLTGGC